MNLLFLSKQNLGVALFLLFIIIISESHILDFFFNKSLGRALFIFFFLSIAYLNNILGVISVLLAILLINSKENRWIEGFTDTPTSETNASETTTPSSLNTTSSPSNKDTITGNNIPTDASGNSVPSPGSSPGSSPESVSTPTPVTSSSTPDSDSNNVLDKEIDKVKKSMDTPDNLAIEGFDILGMENNLKRGKKSNSIPVSNHTRKSENVDPYYQSSFGNSFSYF